MQNDAIWLAGQLLISPTQSSGFLTLISKPGRVVFVIYLFLKISNKIWLLLTKILYLKIRWNIEKCLLPVLFSLKSFHILSLAELKLWINFKQPFAKAFIFFSKNNILPTFYRYKLYNVFTIPNKSLINQYALVIFINIHMCACIFKILYFFINATPKLYLCFQVF